VTQVKDDRLETRARQGSGDGIVQSVADYRSSDEDALQDVFEFPVRSVALASDARNVSFRKIPLRKGAVDKRRIGSVTKVLLVRHRFSTSGERTNRLGQQVGGLAQSLRWGLELAPSSRNVRLSYLGIPRDKASGVAAERRA
jgi:hypothetical protein